MTVHEPNTTAAPDQRHPVITHLIAMRDDAARRADELGAAAGRARQAADEHMQKARTLDEQALAARAHADTWNNLITSAIEEVEQERHRLDMIRATAPARHPYQQARTETVS